MTNVSLQAPQKAKKSFLTKFLTFAALLLASALVYISWLGICTEACGKAHSYRLYGFTFEMFGMVYFPTVATLYFFSNRSVFLSVATAILMSMGIGAELFFIYVQKFLIGHWCPVCLSIAGVLGFASLLFLPAFISQTNINLFDNNSPKGLHMNRLLRTSATFLGIIAGFTFAFAGLGKENELQAEENQIKAEIAFGNPHSPIDVYVFTDWICPACESLEPTFERMTSGIVNKARITFVDDPVHEATLNYTPYNLSFMIHNRPQYFSLRKAMHTLANDKKEPTEQDIAAMASQYGVQVRELPYGAVTMGTKYFDELIKKFNIEGTPTIIVYNRDTKQSKKLEGRPQISQEKVIQAIDALSK